jgi:hypothetical protein
MTPHHHPQRHPLLLLALLACPIVLFACSKTVPPHQPQVSKMPPPSITLSPRSAQLPGTATEVPTPKATEAFLPVTLVGDLRPLQDVIKAAIPESLDEKDNPLGTDFRWTFIRQAEPSVKVENGQLIVHAEYRGTIEAKGATSRGCRLDPLYPVLDWNAHLGVKQMADNLVVLPESPELVVGLKPESDDHCNMFSLPVKDQLTEVLNRNALREQIGQSIRDAQVIFPTSSLWAQLHGPYVAPISGRQSDVCIYPEPSELTFAPLEGTLQQAVLHATAKVYPHARVAQTCETPRIGPQKISERAAMVRTGRSFSMIALLPVPYQVVTDRLQRTLFHMEQALPEGGAFGKRTITIEKVSAGEAGGNLVVTVETRGYVNGPIYYWGTPQLAGTVLTVSDLHMDNETRRMLDGQQRGLSNQVDAVLTPPVRQAIRIDLADDLSQLRTAIRGAHKSQDLVLDLTPAESQPQQVYAHPQGIMVGIKVDGAAKAEGRVMAVARSQSRGPASAGMERPAQEVTGAGSVQTVNGTIVEMTERLFVIKAADGKEVLLSIDPETKMTSVQPKLGDEIVAQVGPDGRTRSIRSSRTDVLEPERGTHRP